MDRTDPEPAYPLVWLQLVDLKGEPLPVERQAWEGKEVEFPPPYGVEAAGVTLWDAKEGGSKVDPGFIPFRPVKADLHDTVHVDLVPAGPAPEKGPLHRTEFESRLQTLIGRAFRGGQIPLGELIDVLEAELEGLKMIKQDGEEF